MLTDFGHRSDWQGLRRVGKALVALYLGGLLEQMLIILAYTYNRRSIDDSLTEKPLV